MWLINQDLNAIGADHPDDAEDDGEDDDAATVSAATISELCTSDAAGVDLEEPLVTSAKDQKLQRLQQQQLGVKSKKSETAEKPDLKALGEQLKAAFEKAKMKSDEQKNCKHSDHHLPRQATCHFGIWNPLLLTYQIISGPYVLNV